MEQGDVQPRASLPRGSGDPRPPAGYQTLLWVQGLYFALTGVWPLVSMETFLAVTGPKGDLWLVQTVGILITVIGLTFLVGAWQREWGGAVPFLAVGSAGALAAVDAGFVAKGILSPVYLLDALVEALLIAWWLVLLFRRQPRDSASPSPVLPRDLGVPASS